MWLGEIQHLCLWSEAAGDSKILKLEVVQANTRIIPAECHGEYLSNLGNSVNNFQSVPVKDTERPIRQLEPTGPTNLN